MEAPLNFEWHIPDLLATSGKIDTDEKLEYIIDQGFGCLIILEAIPQEITKKISVAEINYAVYITEEDEDPLIDKAADFIAGHILDEVETLITCSAGIKRSCQLARLFVSQKDLHLARYIYLRACELDSYDNFYRQRGHSAFSGDSINKVIKQLERGLASSNKNIWSLSAKATKELLHHVSFCDCISRESINLLKDLRVKFWGI